MNFRVVLIEFEAISIESQSESYQLFIARFQVGLIKDRSVSGIRKIINIMHCLHAEDNLLKLDYVYTEGFRIPQADACYSVTGLN